MASETQFLADVESMVAMTANLEQLQEEQDELRVRLATMALRVGSIWEDVSALREELEVRIARLELKARGVVNASSADILATRLAECSPYEDAWNDLRDKAHALEHHAQGSKSKAAEAIDVMELGWVRSALQKHLAELKAKSEGRQGDGQDSEDEAPPAVPPRPAFFEEAERKEERFEDATRVLQVSVIAFKVGTGEEDMSCTLTVDGHKRHVVLSSKLKRATVTNTPMVFARWSPNSTAVIKLVRNGKVLEETELLHVRNLISQRDTTLYIGGGQIVLRTEVANAPQPQAEASRCVVGAVDKKTRGGAHISVPRFVKKLKSLRLFRDTYAKTGSSNGPHAATIEEEFRKPLPDLSWLHEQVLAGRDTSAEVVVNAQNQTLLHVICMVGSPKAVRMLLKKKKYDPHAKDMNGWSPFLYLVSRQDIEGVQTMLYNGAAANDTVWSVSSVHLAALSGNVELVKVLLEHDASLASVVDDKFATPLHYAAYGHRETVVELLLSLASPNVQDLDGHTPLLTAILRKSLPVARLLVSRGALVSHKELWAACQTGTDEFLTTLSELADLREALLQRASPFGHSVMHKCVMFLSDLECCSIVPILIQIPGVSADDVDDNKRSAVSYAVMCGKPNVLKLLIDCGANLKQKDIFQNTLLHLATTTVVCDILQEALGAAAFHTMLHESNLFGWLPLHVARAMHAAQLVSALLGAGATNVPGLPDGLVPSWHYRLSIAYTEGAKNDEMLE